MQCFSPSSVPDKRFKSKRVRLTVPCGNCAACITNKRNEWASRLRIENRYAKSAYFVTLTYSDDNIEINPIPNCHGEIIGYHGTLNKDHIQKFMKRLRKGNKSKIRYYLVGEYGEKGNRPHYHMLIFGLDYHGDRLKKYILDKWNKGTIDIGTVTPASIKYVTNYMIQKHNFQNPFIEKPFALMSKGIGSEYLKRKCQIDKHHNDLERNYMMFEDGQKSKLPRYYRDKIYCENTRIKQNEKAIKDGDDRELRNWEIWAKNNPNQNRYTYEYDQQKDYTKKVEKTLKNNAKI